MDCSIGERREYAHDLSISFGHWVFRAFLFFFFPLILFLISFFPGVIGSFNNPIYLTLFCHPHFHIHIHIHLLPFAPSPSSQHILVQIQYLTAVCTLPVSKRLSLFMQSPPVLVGETFETAAQVISFTRNIT